MSTTAATNGAATAEQGALPPWGERLVGDKVEINWCGNQVIRVPAAVLGRACSRCGAKPGQLCASVGADAYARGAPLRRQHSERSRGAK